MAFDADIKLSDAEMTLDKKLFQIRKQFLSDSEAKKISLYNSSFNELKPLIESSKLFEIPSDHAERWSVAYPQWGITDVKWIISTARKYQECYVLIRKIMISTFSDSWLF